MKYFWSILFIINILIIEICQGYGVWNGGSMDFHGDRCETAIKEILQEDRATVVDETPDRLQSTWLSQECEVRAGPEYVIRKYTFFENGTFLLLRHHYAEESCSVATHTVVARGVIRLLSSSGLAPGATEARYQLDHVHIVPLTRQVAHKFEHRVNITCSPQPKWRPYTPQTIYEQPSQRSFNFLWNSPTSNIYQHHTSTRKLQYRSLNCLETLGIDFNELKLVRVQRKHTTSTAFGLGANGQPRVELYLGSLSPNVYSKKIHRSTSLQPTVLIRNDTTSGCLACGAISRGTENSPPLLHEVAALPALLGGSWISSSCESCQGGLWIKRQIQFYSGDMLWSGRWDYFSGPTCTNLLYSVTAAGSYIQRTGRQRRHGVMESDAAVIAVNEESESDEFENMMDDYIGRVKRSFNSDKSEKKWLSEWINSDLAKRLLDIYGSEEELKAKKMLPPIAIIQEVKTDISISTTESIETTSNTPVKLKRNFDSEDSYRHLLENAQPSIAESFAAMLRGNQRREETTRKPMISITPSGNTELDLHVAESFLIARDLSIAARCGAQIIGDELNGLKVRPLYVWPRNCVKHALESPSILGLRARIGVNWSGQYTLLLGPRDDSLWEAPLRQCGPTPTHNPLLRAHLRQSLGYKYGLFVSSASTPTWNRFIMQLLILLCLYKFIR